MAQNTTPDATSSASPAGGSASLSQSDALSVDRLLGCLHLRAKSLIVTVYGDAILPHGGSCWLGSLIRLVEPLGLSERMVRTAVFRLSQDGILTARPVGRRSYYALTEDGRRQFAIAQRRIYTPPERNWDNRWVFVLLTDDAPQRERDALKKELVFEGFAPLAPNLLAHAAADPEEAVRAIDAHRLRDYAVTLQARADDEAAMTPLKRLVASAWSLERMEQQYRDFLSAFRPILHAVEEGTVAPDAETAFLVRVLLIHDYRRVLLRDPGLPPELLPADWSGLEASALCTDLYRHIAAPAETHLARTVETADGPLPDAAPYFFERFGGIPR